MLQCCSVCVCVCVCVYSTYINLRSLFTFVYPPPLLPSPLIQVFISLHRGHTMKQGGNVATWHSLIEGFNAAGAFRKWRKTQPRLLAPSLGAAGKLKLRKGFPHSTRFGCRALIFPGADASVIRRTSQFCLLYRFIHSSSFLPSSYAVRPSSVYYIGLYILPPFFLRHTPYVPVLFI